MKTYIDEDTVARVDAALKPKAVETKPQKVSKRKRPLLKLPKKDGDDPFGGNRSLLMPPKKRKK